MTLDTRRQGAPSSPTFPAPPAPAHDAHRGLRTWLVALEAFMAVTTISGAIFVVPNMPRDVLAGGPFALFSDYTIPALALGILCGGAALAALVAVIARPRLGAVMSVAAGLFMLIFELVEIAAIGFILTTDPAQPQNWLQIVFLVVGAAIAILGARLWKAETGSYRVTLAAL